MKNVTIFILKKNWHKTEKSRASWRLAASSVGESSDGRRANPAAAAAGTRLGARARAVALAPSRRARVARARRLDAGRG